MGWNNNIKFDKDLKIPYFEKENFIFDNIWSYSIILRFDIENVDIKNLYCIMQSYLWNKEIRVLKIYTGFVSGDNKKILSYSNIFLVKKMNFIYFMEWWDNVYNHDSIYLLDEEKKIYGIIFCFSKSSMDNFIFSNSIKIEEIKYIKPIYPWKKEINDHINFLK